MYMQPDSNTTSHFQWFCFRMRNREVRKIGLRIKNFTKGRMMYQRGLRPYYKSKMRGMAIHKQIEEECVFGVNKDDEMG